MPTVDSMYVLVDDEADAHRLVDLSTELSARFLVPNDAPVETLGHEDGITGARRSVVGRRHSSWAEWLQHLVSLGYLAADAAFSKTPASGCQRRQACAMLVDDLAQASDLGGGAALRNELEDLQSGEPAGPVALSVVEQLLAFDDGMPIPSSLAEGDRGLWSRVLHYRLAALCLYFGPTAEPIGAITLLALRRLDFLLTPGRQGGSGATSRTLSEILHDLQEATGDVEILLRRFTTTLAVDPLAFHDATTVWDSRADFKTLVIIDGEFANTSRLGNWFSGRDTVRPTFRGAIEDRAGDPECRFGLHLMQLALWSSGYYGGRLDGWWGELTHRALRDMARDRGDDIEAVILNFGRGYFAVNLFTALRLLYGIHGHDRRFALTETEFVTAELEAAELEVGQPERRGFWERLRDGVRDALRLGRRVLTSAVSIIRAIGHGLRRGVRAVGRAVGGALQAVGGVFAYIYRGVREAVRVIRRGVEPFLHFILRQPIWTKDAAGRPIAMMDHDLDRDVFHWVAPWASPVQIAAHASLVRRLSRALDLTLSFIVEILDLVRSISLPPVFGWLKLAIKVVGLLRRLFSRRLIKAPA